MASKRLKGKSYREKADAIEKQKGDKPEAEPKEVSARKVVPKAKTTAPESWKAVTGNGKAEPSLKARPGPSGMIMEVVIPISRKTLLSKSPQSSAPSSPADDDESEAPPTLKRKRRAASTRVPIIIDDSDDEPPSKASSPKRSNASSKASSSVSKKRKLNKGSSPASDYRDSDDFEEDSYSDAEVSDSSISSEINEDEELDEPKKMKGKGKGKGKAKAIPKPRNLPPQSATDTEDTSLEDAMDVDSEAGDTKPKKATKRKAANDKPPPAKKAKRAESDPWKLGSKAVQNEWTFMQAPPFEMFHFARVVVDEYTYLDGKIHALITNLTADRQWVLSGTPPTHDFAALKTIAAFLNIHLGVDDDGEGQSAEVKKRKREQTGA